MKPFDKIITMEKKYIEQLGNVGKIESAFNSRNA